MRAPSVSPRGAVPWVPSNEVQRGNGMGETHEEGGKLYLIINSKIGQSSLPRFYIYSTTYVYFLIYAYVKNNLNGICAIVHMPFCFV